MYALNARADWLLKFRVSFVIHVRAIRAEFAPENHIFVLYYLTVLVYTKTTVHVSVGG